MQFIRTTRRRTTDAVIDITPLIDAAFILIIFLLISTTFKRKEHAFTVTLPTAAHEQVKLQVERNSVYVTRQGEMYFLAVSPSDGAGAEEAPEKGEKVTPQELRERLSELTEKDPDTQISILAQQDTDYQHIINAMSEASAAGIKRVQLPYEYAQPPGARE